MGHQVNNIGSGCGMGDHPAGTPPSSLLGVDIGSVSIGLVLMGMDGGIVRTLYAPHMGLIRDGLQRLLAQLPLDGIAAVACTSSTPAVLSNARRFDTQVATIAAARRLHGRLGSLLVIGGERFTLMRFDGAGGYRGLRGNSSCAAGTGSFLDQQAHRLGLRDSAELAEVALRSRGAPPAIASRCSVFAKTDLIHAQQEGYSLEEICDGLCLGLARNVADTLLAGEKVPAPIVFAGGVARNPAVVRHLEALIGTPLAVDGLAHLYGAAGAALCLLKEEALDAPWRSAGPSSPHPLRPADFLEPAADERSYYHPPLEADLPGYPDFAAVARSEYHPRLSPGGAVEVDLYDLPPAGAVSAAILGLDIGSTSTKAVLLEAPDDVSAEGQPAAGGPHRQATSALPGRVLAGFYTRTAGRPLAAVQAILEALDDLLRRRRLTVALQGVGTTGSGRKFVGRVIGTDLVVDEITAHARAACELDPQVDTIIEIGGQDAKFTTLRSGRVTFCQMNTICAAGTGSFIEEQATRLGVPLAEVARRASSAHAPLASDRCTVFMERDINHLLNRGYSVDEILAAVIHSVCENYLLKVSVEGAIGERVCFQGATAKNRALVAAFERRLGRPIFVSRYCHLTGALGVALLIASEKERPASAFRGLGLFRETIAQTSETCELCANRCRIRVVEVQGEKVAFGFACGRDYGTHRFVRRGGEAAGPLEARRRLFSGDPPAGGPAPRIGLPAALHLLEEVPLWKRFFTLLGVETLTSEGFHRSLKAGKQVAGAEFCAPVTALHGHVRWLAERVPHVFLPVYLEAPTSPEGRGMQRSYCYYTQFAPTVVSQLEEAGVGARCLTPLVRHSARGRSAMELARALRPALPARIGEREVRRAYRQALEWFAARRSALTAAWRREPPGPGEVRAVLVGRPYVVLDAEMNKGILEIFSGLGIRAAFQDEVPPDPQAVAEIGPLRRAFHWHYAARILEAAATAARTPGLYPVLVTSFKCAPDSFLIEYFRRILDARDKPYLILQIDEHDSSVGYETRIEAGVRAFRNHAHSAAGGRAAARRLLPVNPCTDGALRGRTLLFPSWDPLTAPLVVANLRRHGIDARALEETELSIRRSMGMNTGQCIPLNAVTQEYIDYVEEHDLDPGRCRLWMARSQWACNIHLFPFYIRSLLEAYGRGFERSGVYAGDVTHIEISPRLTYHAYYAYLFGGLLRRIGCRLRPYETEPGATDRAVGEAQAVFTRAFLGELSLLEAAEEAAARFERVPVRRVPRPKVAIFGDLYVRDNEVMNQDLIRCIEAAGGEVVTTPYSDYTKIVAAAAFRHMARERQLFSLATYRALLAVIGRLERKYYALLGRWVGEPVSWRDGNVERELAAFNVRLEQAGESYDNILKISRLVKAHPDLSLFVQTNPAFCCPSLVTEAMSARIERVTGIPVVTLTYDGTGSFRNDRVVPYLHFSG